MEAVTWLTAIFTRIGKGCICNVTSLPSWLEVTTWHKPTQEERTPPSCEHQSRWLSHNSHHIVKPQPTVPSLIFLSRLSGFPLSLVRDRLLTQSGPRQFPTRTLNGIAISQGIVFVTCLLAGLHKFTLRVVSYENNPRDHPGQTWWPISIPRVSDPLTIYKYGSRDPRWKTTPYDLLLFPEVPWYLVRLRCLEKRPLTPQAQVLSTAFKVYKWRDKKAENKNTWYYWRPFHWP